MQRRVAIVVPCLDESPTIERVVLDFQQVLPHAQVYVIDNNSRDDTAEIARLAGAIVLFQPEPGKGNAVRLAFDYIDADDYVLVDGDATYHPHSAVAMLQMLESGADVVIAKRITDPENAAAFRSGHRVGNYFLTRVSEFLLGFQGADSLTGYRAMSRRFVKTLIFDSGGFELETELNMHAARLGINVVEIESPYLARPEGSDSKLQTYRDGLRLLWANIRLFEAFSPIRFYFFLGLPLLVFAAALGLSVGSTYLATGNVENFPSLIAGSGFAILFVLAMSIGVFSHKTVLARNEAMRLYFLNHAFDSCSRCRGTSGTFPSSLDSFD